MARTLHAMLGRSCKQEQEIKLRNLGTTLLATPERRKLYEEESYMIMILISGQVSLVALGPLTNLALAFKTEPSVSALLQGL